jgi:hypothetical protein
MVRAPRDELATSTDEARELAKLSFEQTVSNTRDW